MKTKIKKSKNVILIALLTIILPTIVLSQKTEFGQRGRDGRDGNNGNNGRSGQNITVIADGNLSNYDLSGQDGTDGTDGELGESAEKCNQPNRPAFSLRGANGGGGGQGGAGGNGGSGGNVLIYYTNVADLKQIKIDNSFGQGGQGGQGERGGQGCSCQQVQWSVNYCKWELWKKPQHRQQNIPQTNPWVFDSNHRTKCTGIEQVDKHRNVPNLPSHYRNNRFWSFKWVYQGIYNTKNFTCQAGQNGKNGQNGSNGQSGKYGVITLVPRKEIPSENITYTDSLSNLVNKQIELVKNVWISKSGLGNFLAIGSNVSDIFTYLDKTIRLRYLVNLESKKTLRDLGIENAQITGTMDLNGSTPKVYFTIPGTLEYRITEDISNSITRLNITGGFAQERVKAFDLKVSGTGENNQIILEDQGKVRPLLKNMTLEIIAKSKESASGLSVSNDYQERLRYQYEIPPTGLPTNPLTENNHVYTLPIGKQFYPWLQSSYHVEYEVIITQVTKMGTVYTQQEKVNFIAE